MKLKIKCSGNIEDKKFNKEMMVEIKSDEQGYHGYWYTTVVTCPFTNDKFLVEYQTLRTADDSEPLRDVIKVLTTGFVHLVFKSLTVMNCLKKLMHGLMMDGRL